MRRKVESLKAVSRGNWPCRPGECENGRDARAENRKVANANVACWGCRLGPCRLGPWRLGEHGDMLPCRRRQNLDCGQCVRSGRADLSGCLLNASRSSFSAFRCARFICGQFRIEWTDDPFPRRFWPVFRLQNRPFLAPKTPLPHAV